MKHWWKKAYVWCYLVGAGMTLYFGYQWGMQLTIAAPSTKPVKVETQSVTPKEQTARTVNVADLYPKSIPVGTNIGTLTIPRINQSLPIIEGADEDELARGVGHVRESVLPGLPDNTVLAGHRDSVFRRLGELKVGDTLEVQSQAGTFIYRVRQIRIVNQDDKTVIVSTYPKPRISVVTCYPFGYIGHAPKRYVLIGDLVNQSIHQ